MTKDFIKSLNWKNPIKAIGNVFLILGLGLFLPTIFLMLKKNTEATKRQKEKFRHFKPEIHEGFLSKKIIWHQREKPLTEEELKQYL